MSMQSKSLHWLIRLTAAALLFLSGCTPLFASTPTATPVPTPTPEPTPDSKYDHPGDFLSEIESGDYTRLIRLHIPSSYQHGTQVPLVLNYHGAGSNFAEQVSLSEMSEKADEEGFIVVYPQALDADRVWYTGRGALAQLDLQFARDIISYLHTQLSIDPKRIYATGLSNGGGMAGRLGCELSDLIAAIAPVSASHDYRIPCEPSEPVAVVAFHGTADEAVPYESFEGSIPAWAAEWAERNSCGSEPKVTFQNESVLGETWGECQDNASVTLYTIDGGRHVWFGSPVYVQLGYSNTDILATDVIWEFFAAHPKP